MATQTATNHQTTRTTHGTLEPSPKHGPEKLGEASAGPKDGQGALNSSVQVKETSPRRVGVDQKNSEIVILDQTSKGKYHGHVRTWKELDDKQRNALINAGLTDKKGRILSQEQ